jgi:BlaI family penicillinase repressor
MKSAPSITDTEWEIMRVIWGKSPISAFEIIERLNQRDSSWHPKTVRALIARLVKKGVIDYEAHGRVYLYYPLVKEREGVAVASESFLERVFGGAVQPMIAHFVENKRLSRKEAEELRRLLEKADK